MGGTIASFSSTLEALQCAHNIQEISDPRQMGSTLQAKLDALEDSVNKFLTLSEVVNKLQKGLGRHLLFWTACSSCSAVSEGFLQSCFPGAVFVSLCHPVPHGLCFLIDNGASSSLPSTSFLCFIAGKVNRPHV